MLKLEHVTKIYRTTSVETLALDDICLTIESGEFLAIMGPSGCGKSTLLNVLGLVDSPNSGAYWLFGTDVARCSEEELTLHRRAGVGFVFQSFNLIDSLNVAENVEVALIYRRVPRHERRKRVQAALDTVALAPFPAVSRRWISRSARLWNATDASPSLRLEQDISFQRRSMSITWAA